jgi:hypothetical protein
VLVRLLPPPPPERIVSPGRRKVAVAVGRGGWQVFNSGVVLAWARLPAKAWDWAMLYVWTGSRRTDQGKALSARWSWCWVRRCQVYVQEPVKADNPWGMTWYGHPNFELDAAIAEVVASLPGPLRAAAMVSVPRLKMLRLDSLNPPVQLTRRV